MLEFDHNKNVFEISVPLGITENDIESIIVNSFEGASTYWLAFKKSDNPLFADKPASEPISTWATKLILEGETIHLFDCEDEEEKFELTLEKLKSGIKEYLNKKKMYDENYWDGETADSIIQYALFGKIVYG